MFMGGLGGGRYTRTNMQDLMGDNDVTETEHRTIGGSAPSTGGEEPLRLISDGGSRPISALLIHEPQA